MWDAYLHMLANGRAEVEARGLRLDGSPYDACTILVSDSDGAQNRTGHYRFTTDITERKQRERVSQREHEQDMRYRSVIQAYRTLKSELEGPLDSLSHILETWDEPSATTEAYQAERYRDLRNIFERIHRITAHLEGEAA
jgi:hypothetical protein